ncbi:MAG: hypothetical protein HWN68_19385, partial [Desulfobacterales bacterium]|nr:hypothetical protein [Desulfobacterales bacterium]
MAIETPEATPLPHAASKITSGVFGIPRGGTNLSTIAAGGILYASALDTLIRIAPTSANQVLRSTGANVLQIASLIAGDIPALDAAKITTGIFVLARIPNMDWAHISGLFPRTIADLLSNHDLARHPLSIIPTMDNGHIPNLETLGYGGAFAAAQIPSLDASKITTGVLGLARIPTMDDTHIPDIETLSYTNPFASGQIPSLDASKITTGTFGLARIPTMDDDHIPNIETLSYGGRFAVAQIPWSSGIDQNLL